MASPRPSHPRTQAGKVTTLTASLSTDGALQSPPPCAITQTSWSLRPWGPGAPTPRHSKARVARLLAVPSTPEHALWTPHSAASALARTWSHVLSVQVPLCPQGWSPPAPGDSGGAGRESPPRQREGLAPNPRRFSQSSRGRGGRAGGGGGASACPAPASRPEPQREESKALLGRRRPRGSPGGGEASRGRGSWTEVQSVAAGDRRGRSVTRGWPHIFLSPGLHSPLTESDPSLPCTPWSVGVRHGWKTRCHLSAPPPRPGAVPATQAARREVAPGPPRLPRWDGGRRGRGGGQLLPGPRGGGACGHTASSDGSPAPGLPAAGQATLGAKTKKEEACVHLRPPHHTPLL